MLPALHGGVIGSLLETAAIAQVIWELRTPRLPKPVDITIDYLRSGRAVTSYARARIAKQGRRVVNVHAEMWQDDEAKPDRRLARSRAVAGGGVGSVPARSVPAPVRRPG